MCARARARGGACMGHTCLQGPFLCLQRPQLQQKKIERRLQRFQLEASIIASIGLPLFLSPPLLSPPCRLGYIARPCARISTHLHTHMDTYILNTRSRYTRSRYRHVKGSIHMHAVQLTSITNTQPCPSVTRPHDQHRGLPCCRAVRAPMLSAPERH